MNLPRVTVCIVTYNQRDYISQCVRSVLDQSDGIELRILLGDDASDDGTSEIAAELAASHRETITYLRREPRMGGGANMRDLIERADGDFIARVDGDDYWLPGKLQAQLTYLQKHPDCVAVYTNAVTVDGAGNRTGLFNDVGDARFDLAAMVRRGNFLNNSSVLFRSAGRHAWLDVDVPQIDYRVHLWHARRGWLGHIGEPLAAYRVGTQDSMVATMNDRVRDMYWQAILSVPRDRVTAFDFASGLADFLRRVAFRAARTHQWHLVREWGTRVFKASPYGTMRTSLLAIASILRMLGKELAGRFRRGDDGRRLRVRYRR